MQKFSRQRDAIIKYLDGNHSHPTASEVYLAVREKFPNISLGTVYRNLSRLSEEGSIRKISTADDADHFDYNTSPHCHFCCLKCHRVTDADVRFSEDLNKTAATELGTEIDYYDLNFYGICNDCQVKAAANINESAASI